MDILNAAKPPARTPKPEVKQIEPEKAIESKPLATVSELKKIEQAHIRCPTFSFTLINDFQVISNAIRIFREDIFHSPNFESRTSIWKLKIGPQK